MQVRNILIYTFFSVGLSLAESNSNTCDSYCYRVIIPVLDRTEILQKQVEAHSVAQENDIKARLDSIERQLKERLECQQKSKDPPNGFRRIGEKYYYIEEKEPINWFAAAHRCRVLGGHLVSLQSRKEHDDLKAQLHGGRNYWIDINDLSKEGQFLSLTTGGIPTYINWQPGNPDNYRNSEHCGGLWNYGGNFLMNDFVCSTAMHFICESNDQ